MDALTTDLREVNERSYSGLTVRLLWSGEWGPDAGRTFVEMTEADGAPFTFEVDPMHAADAFAHPYVYRPAPVVLPPDSTEAAIERIAQ